MDLPLIVNYEYSILYAILLCNVSTKYRAMSMHMQSRSISD